MKSGGETVPEETSLKGTAAPARNGDIPGWALVSTADQDTSSQRAGLSEPGIIRVLTDLIAGKRAKLRALTKPIDHAWPGDNLCVTLPDGPGRLPKEPLETVEDLKSRGIHPISLEKRIDTTSTAGELVIGETAHFERRLIAVRSRQCEQLKTVTAKADHDRRSMLSACSALG